MTMIMRRMSGGSAYTGSLPLGCQLCAKGGKMVLFVSGICDAKCFYCPLSEPKKMKDVMYADEMPLRNMKDAIYEAKMISATGTGITGGDPLKYYQRTSEYITILKEEFGKTHHIHLYTISGTKTAIDTVAKAGLDEIRFHPPEEIWSFMDRSIFKDRIKWSRDNGMSVGIEVPSLPYRMKETQDLIEFARKMDLDFINLNELEFSETNYENLLGRGYQVKSDYESGANGSQSLAIDMVKKFPDFTVHYCSAAFKDGVQLKNRLKRRAKNVARDIDVVTKDGTIIRGIVEGADTTEMRNKLISLGMDPEEIHVNPTKNRLEVPPWILQDIRNSVEYDIYEIEEYPTWDALEVERVKI
ncbi:MAG: 4Fe-4S cluster-binding domain-containing protein [Thermoplasmataceae archaeon]